MRRGRENSFPSPIFTSSSPFLIRSTPHQEAIYNILFKAAAQTLIELASTRLGVQIGITAVLHTWGQNLMDHPHLHCIVTGGGLAKGEWLSSKRRFLFPHKVMSRLFKGKFLSYLKKAYEGEELQFPGLTASLQKAWKNVMKGLYHKDWVVYCKPPFNGPETVVAYLGRYTHRVAITNHRLIGMEDGRISFLWKDYADGNKRKTMTLDALEFIRRFLLHVLPDGFVKIRYFGLFANRIRKATLEICRELLGVAESQAVCETWQKILLRLTGIDVTRCPLCGGRIIRKELSRGPPC